MSGIRECHIALNVALHRRGSAVLPACDGEVCEICAVLARFLARPPHGTATRQVEADVAEEVDELVTEFRELCAGHGVKALMCALTEMTGRVLSDSVHREAPMEEWMAFIDKYVRGWWVSDRGGPFQPS